MARTFKDKREFKTKRKKLFQPLWTKRFERSHYEGNQGDNDDLDFCPWCNATTDFQSGFINCTKCNWGNYYPANGAHSEDEEVVYESAA